MRLFLLALSACVACTRAPAASPAAPAAPASARAPRDLRALGFQPPPGMRFYYLVLLRRGPRWTAEETEESRRHGAGHMANIERLAADGTLVLAGPFADSEGAGDLAGIFVLAVGSLAEARAAMEADPAVSAGRFTVELRAWLAADGIRTASEPTPPAALGAKLRCRSSDRHEQFDFWLGDWEVRTPGGELAGRNRIEKGQYGCVLREYWRGTRGGTGQSINYVDPSTGQWVQLWVDFSGGVIQLRGGLDGSSMALAGDHLEPGAPARRMRARWTPIEGGKVRQLIEESPDGGKTWATWFEGIYSRR